jgi:hypothetical protein
LQTGTILLRNLVLQIGQLGEEFRVEGTQEEFGEIGFGVFNL